MKYDTKYCFIENNGKNYQLNLTQPYPSAVYAFDQIVAHTRFLMPVSTLVSGAFLGLSIAGGAINALALQLTLSFLVVSGICYLPGASFPTGLSALLRNNKIKKTLKNFYDEMRSLEFQKLSRKMKESVCLKEQQKLAKQMLKIFERFQRKNLKQAVRYEKKLNKGKDLSTAQSFAYGQIESSILTIDKFIFHNYLLLKNLCPSKESFLQERINYYNDTIIAKNRHLSDEIIRLGINPSRSSLKNDDILNRESTYVIDLCRKLGYISKNTNSVNVNNSIAHLSDECRKITQQDLDSDLLVISDTNTHEREC